MRARRGLQHNRSSAPSAHLRSQYAVPNDLFLQLGIEGWKPALSALLLPPVPMLLLIWLGARLARQRSAWAAWLLLAAAAGIWLTSTSVLGEWLQQRLLAPAHALAPQDLRQLQAAPATRRTGAMPDTAIVVLGGGRESHAPEYGGPNLAPMSLQRLRYGLWLARETSLPVAFSGGTGHAQSQGPGEAEVAAQIALREFGQPLKWVESSARDTRENAERSVALLRPAGVTRIVLVTHGWHMRRSLRAFEQAIQRSGGGLAVVAAPMGLARDDAAPPLRWLPSSQGFEDTRQALHEILGLLFGA
jgi:uncharacterized SAM-binding protein YcdF (DUF218 family)